MSSRDFRKADDNERRYLTRDCALYLDVSSEGEARLELIGDDPEYPGPCIALDRADTLDLIDQLNAIVGRSFRANGPTGTDFAKGNC